MSLTKQGNKKNIRTIGKLPKSLSVFASISTRQERQNWYRQTEKPSIAFLCKGLIVRIAIHRSQTVERKRLVDGQKDKLQNLTNHTSEQEGREDFMPEVFWLKRGRGTTKQPVFGIFERAGRAR